MELTKFEDFKKYCDRSKLVWFVGVPEIKSGYNITDSYTLSFPIVAGFLYNMGYDKSKEPYEESVRFGTTEFSNRFYNLDDINFKKDFKIYDDDTNTLNGCKIFTETEEADEYWNSVREQYLEKLNEIREQYTINLSDICEKFGIDKSDMHKVRINQYQ